MSLEIKESLNEFKQQKNIDRHTSSNIIESTFRNLINKKYGDDSNFDFIINEKSGDFEIWQSKTIVADDEVENNNKQISISDAHQVESDFEIGEEFPILIPLNSFDRRDILNARQMIKSKVDESQKINTYNRYLSIVGEIIEGEVQLVRNNGVILIDDQGTEMFLSKEDMILDEYFRKGDRVKSVLESVTIDKGNLKINLSRVEDLFLTKLLELEVTQISDGLIDIIDVVRFPGIKAKVLVESYDDRIDPIGLIVGSGGSRIKSINRELRGEQIDIISNTSNLQLLVRRLFSGTNIDKIEIDGGTVRIFVEQDYIGRIMGKYNSNLELASEILDKQIEVYSVK
jgi:N utilization substance protein A